MAWRRILIIVSILSLFIGLYLSGYEFLSLTCLIMIILVLPVLFTSNTFTFHTRELIVLALIGTIAALFRLPFALLPSVQPTTFIIIATAIVIGPYGGLVIGLLAAFISNLYLGHGLWTLFQMFGWGLIGFYAGLFRKTLIMRTVIGRSIYGFLTGILFGWLMNLSFLIFIVKKLEWKLIVPYFVASLPFDLNHAITNTVLLLLFSSLWINFINRLTINYHLFQEINKRK